MYQYSALTLNSSNKKTGDIAVSTTLKRTCPDSCSFRDDGSCYAEAGYYTRLHWDRVTEGATGLPPLSFIKKVGELHASEMFRHNVAGDLWHSEYLPQGIDGHLALELAKATNHLYAAWTYTHHTVDTSSTPGEWNGSVVLTINANSNFVINLSTESVAIATKRYKEGFMVTVVQPENTPRTFKNDGVRFVQCPATLPGSTITCKTCGGRKGKPLCANKDRNCVVVFPAHGGRKTKAASHCS